MKYNYVTYRAVVIAWLQMVIGRIWHFPARVWNIYRFHTEPCVDPEVFRARIQASVARIRAAQARREEELKRIANDQQMS